MNSDLIKQELEKILSEKQSKISLDNTLKIDLHCHDKNSDEPSERLGRMLGIPETWLKTEDLLKCLERNHTSAITITNHNNARSCWDLLDKGYDVLSGAEFTCNLPKSKLSIHVLTYGFTPEQEFYLNKNRGNLYDFLYYCKENGILPIWAHPLFFSHSNFSLGTIKELEHIATLFSHFEIVNGQRDSYQNLVTANWINTFDEEKVERISKGFDIKPELFNPGLRTNHFVGGSDDHVGLFSGSSGTYVQVNNLEERLKTSTKADLVLEGLKLGNIAPYGTYTDENKMSISFLELFYMIVKNMEDPGLVRMMLHKGSRKQKISALLLNNSIAELRRHKFTLQFLNTFHNSLHGEGLKYWQQAFVKKSAKPMLKEIDKIAQSRDKGTEEYTSQTHKSLITIFEILNKQVVVKASNNIKEQKLENLLEKFEIPATFRSYVETEEVENNLNLGKLFDNLSFPVLASTIIGAAGFISTTVQNQNKEIVDYLSKESGMIQKEKRMLWLTDTFTDKNGIAISLNTYKDEIQSRDLPIDILVCHEDLKSSKNIIVTKPIGTFPVPIYKDQIIRIPNLLDIQEIFKNGNYDRVICSTELIMGAVGLYLKKAFNIPAYFFMHTDWLDSCGIVRS